MPKTVKQKNQHFDDLCVRFHLSLSFMHNGQVNLPNWINVKKTQYLFGYINKYTYIHIHICLMLEIFQQNPIKWLRFLCIIALFSCNSKIRFHRKPFFLVWSKSVQIHFQNQTMKTKPLRQNRKSKELKLNFGQEDRLRMSFPIKQQRITIPLPLHFFELQIEQAFANKIYK